MPRNAPPVAGNIMWARQLLRRIETPMQHFAQNKALMATKESKKIVKTYNKVAKALIEFETLWHQVNRGEGGCCCIDSLAGAALGLHALGADCYRSSLVKTLHCCCTRALACARARAHTHRTHINTHTHTHARTPPLQAWLRSIESCKAGLAAPLLVQHPETGKILVNFDKEIMQLIRETKYMQRFSIPVPESAQMVLLQVRNGVFGCGFFGGLGEGALGLLLMRSHLQWN